MDVKTLNANFGAPGRIVFRDTPWGVPNLSLANQYGSAEISLFGAQILQYRPTGNVPVLFQPADMSFASGREVHGGIPVCWPWFGKCGEPGSRSHGLARYMPFGVRGSDYSEEESSVTLFLKSSDATRELWPHEFDLEYRISLTMKLNLQLRTTNRGEEPFTITEGFHPYFRVRNRDDVTVRGLDGCPFCDARVSRESDKIHVGDLRANDALDHVFTLDKREFALIDPGLRRAIAMVTRGNSKLVVWNPGPFEPGRFRNLEADDWKKFLCVEPATLFREDGVTIRPGESHELIAAIQSVPET